MRLARWSFRWLRNYLALRLQTVQSSPCVIKRGLTKKLRRQLLKPVIEVHRTLILPNSISLSARANIPPKLYLLTDRRHNRPVEYVQSEPWATLHQRTWILCELPGVLVEIPTCERFCQLCRSFNWFTGGEVMKSWRQRDAFSMSVQGTFRRWSRARCNVRFSLRLTWGYLVNYLCTFALINFPSKFLFKTWKFIASLI